jgi:ring-1,2-phenylacetyl-CoA epoxidase subunit PaaD
LWQEDIRAARLSNLHLPHNIEGMMDTTVAAPGPPPATPSPKGEGSIAFELQRALAIAAGVVDPEIPVLTLQDLGVLRGVDQQDGRVVLKLTPTYTGCPATEAISLAVEAALAEAGFVGARVETVLSPPWTTDDITEEGRRKLREFGIAPPQRGAAARTLFHQETVECPKCGSTHTSRISEFGSTACKALWRCEACAEPFDYFKCL